MNISQSVVSSLKLNAKLYSGIIARNLPKAGQSLFVRHKATIRTYRQRLPRYKRNLMDLPPLTKLLTQSEIDDVKKLRLEKVEVYKKYMPVDASTILLEALFNTDADIDDLLKVIDENLETMTSFYIGISFEAIDDMLRARLCDKDTVIVSPEFKKLCTKTLYKVRFFEADEVLKLVKCLSSLEISDETLIVQAALNMARHLINDFKPEEMKFITDSYDLLKAPKFIPANLGESKPVTVVDVK